MNKKEIELLDIVKEFCKFSDTYISYKAQLLLMKTLHSVWYSNEKALESGYHRGCGLPLIVTFQADNLQNKTEEYKYEFAKEQIDKLEELAIIKLVHEANEFRGPIYIINKF